LKHKIDELSFIVEDPSSHHASAFMDLDVVPPEAALAGVAAADSRPQRTHAAEHSPASSDGGSVTRRLREGSTSRHVHEHSAKSPAYAQRGPRQQTDRRVLLAGVGIVAVAALVVLGLNWIMSEPAEVDPIPALVKQLKSPDPKERLAGADGLTRLGPRAGPAVPDLVYVLRGDPRSDVRFAAAQALVHCGVSSDIVGPELAVLLPFETDPTVRQMLKNLVDGKP
jgi:hypothetical protein